MSEEIKDLGDGTFFKGDIKGIRLFKRKDGTLELQVMLPNAEVVPGMSDFVTTDAWYTVPTIIEGEESE